jgi:hypothetical protein
MHPSLDLTHKPNDRIKTKGNISRKILVASGEYVGSQRKEGKKATFSLRFKRSIRLLQPHPTSIPLDPYERPNYVVCQYISNFNTTLTLFANSGSTFYTHSFVG